MRLTLLTIWSAFGQPVLAERPAFQAPFPCGQVWDASTYEGHGSNAIDLAERNEALENIGQFQPAIASAAGKVVLDHTWPGGDKLGERWIMLDHGDGWRSHYMHLDAEEGKPRFEIGRRIAQGEVLGRVSNSGSESVHLHFAQMKNTAEDATSLNQLAVSNVANWRPILRDGDTTRIRFDNALINTYLANTDSWKTFGSNLAENIQSVNCAGGEFPLWTVNGDRHLLRYDPQRGRIRINTLAPASGTSPQTLDLEIGNHWTRLMPFRSQAGKRAHLMLYNFATGELAFHRIAADFSATSYLQDYSIYAGWTHLEPLYFGGAPYFVAYDSRYGHFNIVRINPTNDGFTDVLKTQLGKGFTHLVPFSSGTRRYLLMYKAGSGKMRILRIHREQNNLDEQIRLETTWSDSRARNWSHLVALDHAGKNYLLGYQSGSGKTRVWRLDSKGEGIRLVTETDLPAGFTSITPYVAGDKAHILATDLESGDARKFRLRNNLTGLKEIYAASWQAGFR